MKNPVSRPRSRRPPPVSLTLVVLCVASIIAVFAWKLFEVVSKNFEGLDIFAPVLSAIALIVSLIGAAFSSKPVRRSLGPGRTARILSKVPASWRRIDNVETTAGFFDQVFVGPAGIYAVTARTPVRSARVVRGRLVVDGESLEGAAEPMANKARSLQAEIGAPVTPVLFFHGVEFPRNARSGGVPACGANGLLRLLTKSPPVLGPDEVRVLGDAIAEKALTRR